MRGARGGAGGGYCKAGEVLRGGRVTAGAHRFGCRQFLVGMSPSFALCLYSPDSDLNRIAERSELGWIARCR